jgi:signal transduction histidine kinase
LVPRDPARLVAVQEAERKRLAELVHDRQVPMLTDVQLQLGVLEKRLGDHDEVHRVRVLQDRLSAAIISARRLMIELYPSSLDRVGLFAAVNEYAAMVFDDTVDVSVSGRLSSDLDAETMAIVYRIAQEALHNAAVHARATQVEVSLEERDGGVRLEVRDDGTGFAQADRSDRSGLARMTERASVAGGWSDIAPALGSGTIVTAWVPR